MESKSALTLPKLRFKGFKGEWERKTLYEISKLSKGKNLSKESLVENGKNKCILYGELFTTYKSIIEEDQIISKTNTQGYESKPNSLLFPSSSTSKDDFFPCSSLKLNNIHLGLDISIFEIDNKNSSDFLAYTFSNKTNLRRLYRLTEGTTINHLYASDIANYKIFLPSLPEQQKIAHFFSLLDKQIKLWERKLELYELIENFYSNKLINKEEISSWNQKIKDLCYIPEKKEIEKKELKNFKKLILKLNNKGFDLTNDIPKSTIKGRPYYIRNSGELLIGKQNIHNKSFIILKNIPINEYVTSNALMSLLPKRNVNLEKIFYIMKTKKWIYYVDSLNSATGQKEYSENQILNLKIPYSYVKGEKIKLISFQNNLINKIQEYLNFLKVKKEFYLKKIFI